VRRRSLAGWGASLQTLAGAFNDLVRAELAALGDDLSRSGRRLGGALLLLASALFVLFWAIGLTFYVAVEVVHQWLPRWGAAAAVLGVVLLLMAILAAIGWRRLRRIEAPQELLQRRWQSHREWWLEQFPSARPDAPAGLAEDPSPPDESHAGD
jgi:uncharacterized membrane protein YqjE